MKTRKFLRERSFLAALMGLLLGFCSQAGAQNVTVRPATGNLVSALTAENEVGFERGHSSLWKHVQLPLTYSASDYPELTEGGQTKTHACNFMADPTDSYLINFALATPSYNVLSLPKGYRFTGYRIVILNNYIDRNVSRDGLTPTIIEGDQPWYFYETGSDFNTSSPIRSVSLGSTYTGDDTEYVIERTSTGPDDMGDLLYFVFSGNVGTSKFAAITYKSFEVFFTAEGDFDVPVAPGEDDAEGRSWVEVPFHANKMDIGQIEPHTKNGMTYYSYDYANVEDLPANMLLYEAAAVGADKKVGSGTATGSIISVLNGGKSWFGLGNNTYYVESPVSVTTQDGTDSPIGYRITGATFNYSLGVESEGTGEGFNIKLVVDGEKYYLAPSGTPETSGGYSRYGGKFEKTDSPLTWYFEGAGEAGYTDGSDYVYTLIGGQKYYLDVNTSGSTVGITNNRNDLALGTDPHVKFTSDGLKIYNQNLYLSANGWNYNHSSYNFTAAWYSHSSLYDYADKDVRASFSPAESFTLKVYDEKGELKATQSVTGNGSYRLDGLNNDAVKFEIAGLPTGKKALMSVDVTMQALNPYVNRLNIVCHDPNVAGRTLSQSFTSNDFMVKGGHFEFYIPSEFDLPCKFTFEKLHSNYGDQTYYDGTTNGSARYSLVSSHYYDATANVYDSNPDADYTTKISTDKAGTQRFRFNNADELINTSTDTSMRYYEEYPFTKDGYLATGGLFSGVEMNNGDDETFYLFTCDETRYNIAPTRATEHRMYAYYDMGIKLVQKDFNSKLTFEKIYDVTLYNDGSADQTKSMYGLKLETTFAGDPEMGYLTAKQIGDAIDEKLGTEGCPESRDQILYVDASPLSHLLFGTEAGAEKDNLKLLEETLSPNVLFYLPKDIVYSGDNFAYQTAGGEFRACNNIVLRDKIPFYAPYDITLDAANYAVYERGVTADNGVVTSATVMLPFALTISGGTHTDDECSFTLNEMSASDCLSYGKEEDEKPIDFKTYAKFVPVSGTQTVANRPYMVNVGTAPAGSTTLSFVARQYGTKIVATTDGMNADYSFDGEAASGSINSGSYSFKNMATYSGIQLPKDDGWFYFNKNHYVSSKNLSASYPNVLMLPFRGYYQYEATGGARDIKEFSIYYGDDQGVTLIGTVGSDEAGTVGGNNAVYDLKGRMMGSQADGLQLPKGVYVVNGRKMVVR